jgi:hypothetical protein
MTLRKANTSIDRKNIRKNLIEFEEQIKSMDDSFVGDSVQCPLKHSFSDGIYVREIFIPAGMYIVGKIHFHEHPNFLLKGEVDVITEDGKERLVGPLSMISKAGTKRALYAITDLVWVTVHLNPTNTRDLGELEKLIIAESYEVFDVYQMKKNKKSILQKAKDKIRSWLK